jgi:integrase/recombinase XerD
MKAHTKIVLDTRRLKSTELYPVKLRVTFNRKQKYYPVNHDLTKTEFTSLMSPSVKGKMKELRLKVDAIEQKAVKIIDKLDVFTFNRFESKFLQANKAADDIFPFFDEYRESLKKQDRIKSAEAYGSAKFSFKSYRKNIAFRDITGDFLNDYEHSMLKEGKSITTVGMYVRCLRSIYNIAVRQGTIKKDEHYPFTGNHYIIPKGKNVKKALSKDEIAAIFKYETVPLSPEDKARDFYLLSYYCNGANMKDILRFKGKNVDGEFIRFKRSKTLRTTKRDPKIITCYISEHVRNIILKWGDINAAPDVFVFPLLVDEDSVLMQEKKIAQFIKNTNKYMRRIASKLEIDKPVLTYSARHTFSTVLKRSGASTKYIQESLGHGTETITEGYLSEFEDEVKKEMSSYLTNF